MTNAALKRLPRHECRHRLDLLGAGLLMIATITLLLALNWGGLRYPWLSVPILSLFAGSLLFWALFALRLRVAREPLIPLELSRNLWCARRRLPLRNRTFIGLTIYVPVYFEGALGLSATEFGYCSHPLHDDGHRRNAFRASDVPCQALQAVALAGLALAILASGVLIAGAGRLSLPFIEITLFATSLGLGTLLPVATVSIQNAVVLHQLGTATAVANFFRQLGGALIVAVFGAIAVELGREP